MFTEAAPLPARTFNSLKIRRYPGLEVLGRWSMTLVPVMWAVWGVLTVAAVALYLYRSSLTRDEEDQIYLDDAFQHERSAQEAIVAKVGKIEPALRVAVWLVAAWTLLVVAYYIWDIVVQFK